jgi:hypothetical protein
MPDRVTLEITAEAIIWLVWDGEQCIARQQLCRNAKTGRWQLDRSARLSPDELGDELCDAIDAVARIGMDAISDALLAIDCPFEAVEADGE